ncbi:MULTISPECIES: DUF7144 family membrane protein [Streptomyces]|uniref:DUF7144 family membrane protein n=1 Tax=Streptomyces TaxID=1883 RepID=UPI000C4209AC|nr:MULTISPECIES: hypothetical protein [Streptomyces]PIB03762.1 hypothetical protein B1C81_35850 [Streptomyces sp. HG99]
MSQDASQPSGTPHATGDPSHTAGDPARTTGDPARTTGDPSRTTGTGAPGSGVPSGGQNAWAAGGAFFAGILMVVNGILAVLQGIAAIAEDAMYASVDGYMYRINLTGWGWILVILGAVAIATGWGILKDAEWARVTGIVIAALSMIAQFLFLPYAPLWSFIVIAVDFFVIWALATYRPVAARA